MSDATTKFVYVTYIVSTPEKIFAAITRPEIARQYWGHENVSDWQTGSDWQHVRADAERPVRIAGKVLACDPPRRLVLTWASPADVADPAAYSRVTYEIEPFENMARLTVTHDELPAGGKMATDIGNGWPRVLSSLKSFLETGRGLDVFAQPKAA